MVMCSMMGDLGMLEAVMEFGRKYNFGRGLKHPLKVRDLALKIFDGTRRLGLHDMGTKERLWLEVAALLHDRGVSVGEEHHVYSKKLILESNELRESLDLLSLKIVAWIAFFHRKKPNPLEYSDVAWRKLLRSEYGDKIVKLAAILRIADALDRSLWQVVEDIKLKRCDDALSIEISSRGDALTEIKRAQEKAWLFEKVFGLKLRVRP